MLFKSLYGACSCRRQTHRPSSLDLLHSNMTGDPAVPSKFDPSLFRLAEARSFSDLQVGETFRSPSRTVTEAHFAAFQLLSGDNHPIHYDVEYCRQHGHRDLLAHGLEVLAFTAAGAGSFAHAIGDCLVAFTEVS